MYEYLDGIWQTFRDLSGIEAGVIFYKFRKPVVVVVDIEFEQDKEIQAFIRQELKRRLRHKMVKNDWIKHGFAEVEISMDELFDMLSYGYQDYGA